LFEAAETKLVREGARSMASVVRRLLEECIADVGTTNIIPGGDDKAWAPGSIAAAGLWRRRTNRRSVMASDSGRAVRAAMVFAEQHGETVLDVLRRSLVEYVKASTIG
jgi:hypothetical protein